MSKLETRIISSEHCFFDYFPVAFRFEDLCLCESHARQVMEALESNLTPRAADECPDSSDGKHEFYQGSAWRICAHCGTRR